MTPFLTRYRRRWIAACAATLLAFAQAALAVSGCLSSAMPTSESGCEEYRQGIPNDLLCRTHLQAQTQTLDIAKLPELPALNTPVLGFMPERALVSAEIRVRFPAQVPVAGPPPPPLNVLYSRSLT